MKKKMIKSTLCVLLSIIMISSLAISAYADNIDEGIDIYYLHTYGDYNNIICSAQGSTMDGGNNTFIAATSPYMNGYNIRYMDVVSIVFGNYYEGDSDGSLMDSDAINLPIDSLRTVQVIIHYYGDEWTVNHVGTGHTIIDYLGQSCTEGTYLDY